MIKDISFIRRIEEAHRCLEELSTLGKDPPRSEIEVRQAVGVVSYQCNQALVRATEEFELLRSVCRILVEVGRLRMAWVGYKVFDKEKTVQPVAQAGYEDGYLEGINITWADSERGRGPTGTAIRTGTVSSNSDILTDPQMAPWRTEALRRGYASSIALPLMSRGEAFGALALYAEERDAFNQSTVKQYTDLANNLAYGVIALRTREERARSEEALRASAQRLQDIIDNTTSIIFVKDLELRYLLVNREYERRHDVRREEIRGKTDFDIHPQVVAEAVRANDRRVIVSNALALRDQQGRILKWYGSVVDLHDWKQAQEALRMREAELAHATRVMTMGEVASSIAHEVNQPLGAIINYANAWAWDWPSAVQSSRDMEDDCGPSQVADRAPSSSSLCQRRPSTD